ELAHAGPSGPVGPIGATGARNELAQAICSPGSSDPGAQSNPKLARGSPFLAPIGPAGRIGPIGPYKRARVLPRHHLHDHRQVVGDESILDAWVVVSVAEHRRDVAHEHVVDDGPGVERLEPVRRRVATFVWRLADEP